jgi:hypothetical protein
MTLEKLIDNPLGLAFAIVLVAIGGMAAVTYFTHTPWPGMATAARNGAA